MSRFARAAALAVLLAAAATTAALAQDPAPLAPELADAVAGARAGVGAPRGGPLGGDELEARTKEVAGLLRCPVCQGLSVGDSPATMAQNMRRQVRDLLAAGYQTDQVLAYFEGSYGEFVRLEPAFRGVNRVVWLAPLVGLALGGAVVVWALRRGALGPAAAAVSGASAVDESAPSDRVPKPSAALPDRGRLPADPRLAAYVLKVREQAYGWPGGLAPASAQREAVAAEGGPPAASAPAGSGPPAASAPAADAS